MSRSFALSVTAFISFVLFGSFIVWGQRPEVPSQPNQDIKPITAVFPNRDSRVQRIREGTKVKDQIVFFRQTGDRTVLYVAENHQRFVCHENLELERVLKVIQEQPGRDFWKIEGEFTEFRGENFILLRRAVIAQTPTEGTP